LGIDVVKGGRHQILQLLSFLFILSTFTPLLLSQSGPKSEFSSPKREKYVQGQLIVRYKPNTMLKARARLSSRTGATTKRNFQHLPDVELVRLASVLPVQSAMRIFRDDQDVLYAEPDYMIYPDDGPNDPLLWLLWGLNNSGLDNGLIGADIRALNAWTLTTGTKDVVVGVIDSGIDYTHPDLLPNLFHNPNDCTFNYVDDDKNGFADDCWGWNSATDDPFDYVGHGTHTAGTIGAAGNNGIGVTGVNWSVTLLPCKFLTLAGGSVSDAISCLDYIATMKDRGYNIVATNNSWGGSSASQALFDAIKTQMNKGILLIAASGNDAQDNDLFGHYPATYDLPNVVSVAASDRTDRMATFSDVGKRTVHLSAPGVGVVSTYPGQTYQALSGTSMATPQVTGVAALLKAFDPNLDWKAIKNRILAGGRLAPDLSATLTGRALDAYGALTCSNSEVLGRRTPRNEGAALAIGDRIKISALHINCGAPAGNVDVRIEPSGIALTLQDNGNAPDAVAGDGIYSAYFEPASAGTYQASLPNGDTFAITVLKPYKYSSTSYNYRQIAGTNLLLEDEKIATLKTPFPVHFGGQTFSKLYIGDNGLISFDHPFNLAPALPIPFFEGGAFVAAWWDDFMPLYPGDQNVFWDVVGTAPDRELVVEWRNVPHYSTNEGSVTFQVVFSESKDDVYFNYSDVSFEGMWYQFSGAALGTVGIQIDPATATTYTSFGVTSSDPLLTGQLSIRWQTTELGFQLDTPNPEQITLPNNSSANFSLQVSTQGAFNREVQLTCGDLPIGATCSFSQSLVKPLDGAPVLVSGTVTVKTDNAADFMLTVVGSTANMIDARTLSIPVHVTPNPDFALSSPQGLLKIGTWESRTFAVNVRQVDGYAHAVSSTCSVSPAGPLCSVTPTSLVPSGQLSVTVSGNSAPSATGYQVTLQVSDGTIVHSLTFPLTVTNYNVSPSPLIIGNGDNSAWFQVYPNGCRGTIALGCDSTGLPAGSTCTTDPAQLIFTTDTAQSVLIHVNLGQLPAGVYQLNLLTTPMPSGPTRATGTTVTIPSVIVEFVGPEPALSVGETATQDIQITSSEPIVGGVDLSVFNCVSYVTCTISPSHVELTGSPVHATLSLSLPDDTAANIDGQEYMLFADVPSLSYRAVLRKKVIVQDFVLTEAVQVLGTQPNIEVMVGHQTAQVFKMQETGGLNVPVSVECSHDMPPGLTCQFDRTSVGAGETFTLTVAAAPDMTPSLRYIDLIYRATINGRLVRHVLTELVRLGNFKLLIEPDTQSLPVGSEALYFITVYNNEWMDGGTTVNCTSPGPGVVCESPLTGSVNGKFGVTARSTPGITPIGNYYFDVTVSSLGDSQTIRGFLNVQGANAIVVTAPNAYDLWTSGTKQITWRYYGDPGSTVKIELLKNGVVDRLIADHVPIGTGGKGYYSWAIPDSLPFSQYYKIRVTSDTLPTATDDSDERVWIGRGVDFVDNLAGYVLYTGDYFTINYTWSGMSTVRLDLYKSGKFIKTIVDPESGGYFDFGHWTWAITAFGTQDLAPGTDYTVSLVPIADPTRAVMSPVFTISHTSITITSPKKDDGFKPGDTMHIQWTWIGDPVSPGADVTVTCCGAYQDYRIGRAIPLGSAGSGSVDWKIPTDIPWSNLYSVAITANYGRGTASSAGFWIGERYSLTAIPSGQGQIQKLYDWQIVCGAGATQCSAYYFKDSVVQLRAMPNYGYSFAGWTGDCSGTGDCILKMEKDVTVGAEFVSPDTFTFTGNDVSGKTIHSGGSAQYTFSASPGARMQNDISFTCAGLPLLSTCTFSPGAVLKISGPTNVTLTIKTTGTSAAAIHPGSGFKFSSAVFTVLTFLMVGFVFSPGKRLGKGAYIPLAALMLGLCLSCGGGGSGSGGGGSPNPPPVQTTPSGTYTVTVKATAGSVSQTTSVQLIVD
jgi:subtilisin family serine protease